MWAAAWPWARALVLLLLPRPLALGLPLLPGGSPAALLGLGCVLLLSPRVRENWFSKDAGTLGIQEPTGLDSPQSILVDKVCGQPQEREAKPSPDNIVQAKDMAETQALTMAHSANLNNKRREFINYMKRSRTFYASIAERLCDGDLVMRDSSTCWNGEDVVESSPIVPSTLAGGACGVGKEMQRALLGRQAVWGQQESSLKPILNYASYQQP
ncbi:Glypican-5 [Chelonia mydas]|uniref:Glypican-5 n=1 Tax=Chelonia mydas TaxID=8469 RepID=M7BH24_CHEMY|nr:Glypican-5 [Chelonia mydas]